MAQRIKKGDRVFVNSGKDSGKTGEVMKIQGLKAIVKDVNVSKKHQKQEPLQQECLFLLTHTLQHQPCLFVPQKC